MPHSFGNNGEIDKCFLFQNISGIEISVPNKILLVEEKQYCRNIKLVPSLRTFPFLIISFNRQTHNLIILNAGKKRVYRIAIRKKERKRILPHSN